MVREPIMISASATSTRRYSTHPPIVYCLSQCDVPTWSIIGHRARNANEENHPNLRPRSHPASLLSLTDPIPIYRSGLSELLCHSNLAFGAFSQRGMMTHLQNGLIYPFVAVRFHRARIESIRSISHARMSTIQL